MTGSGWIAEHASESIGQAGPMTATATITTTTHHIRCTCILDGRCHLVSDEELAAALTAVQRRVSALCGRLVVPAALSTPDGRPCPACAAASGPSQRRRRRSRLLPMSAPDRGLERAIRVRRRRGRHRRGLHPQSPWWPPYSRRRR